MMHLPGKRTGNSWNYFFRENPICHLWNYRTYFIPLGDYNIGVIEGFSFNLLKGKHPKNGVFDLKI